MPPRQTRTSRAKPRPTLEHSRSRQAPKPSNTAPLQPSQGHPTILRRSSRLNPAKVHDDVADSPQQAPQLRRSARVANRLEAPNTLAKAPRRPTTSAAKHQPSQSNRPQIPKQKQVNEKEHQGDNRDTTRKQRNSRGATTAVQTQIKQAKSSKVHTTEEIGVRKAKSQKDLQIASWFDGLTEHTLEELTSGADLPNPVSDNMAEGPVTSSATSYSAQQTTETQSQTATTEKGRSKSGNGRTGKDVDKLYDYLCVRNADPIDRQDDDLRGEIEKLVNLRKKISLLYKDSEELRAIVHDFVDNLQDSTPSRDIFDDYEQFRDNINAWNPTRELFTITNRDFELDRQHSLANNEAVLQRTVLISMIDRWQLNKMFTFNCEGHWKMAKNNLLPTPPGDTSTIGGLKADLVIFYRFNLFAGMKYSPVTFIKEDLKGCAFPDGNVKRCFPFIFIEAKRGEHDLTYALYSNMLNASQALWNMYKWMEAGKQSDTFFQQVRVFSISLNAKTLVVRIHRAMPDPEAKTLKFVYDDLYTLPDYTRNEANLLIRNLLLEYGLARLRGYLISAYEKIIGRKLSTLREIPELWDLAEVQDAVTRMEAESATKTAAAQTNGGLEAEANQAVPITSESSKRAAPNRPQRSGERRKVRKSERRETATSFGYSGLKIV